MITSIYIREEICIIDMTWENPPHVAQGNLGKIQKLVWKLLCFSLFFINLYNLAL